MFNKNFKRIRLRQGLSQKQVADYLNVSPQSISKWEKGEALPSIDFLPGMAECLNCEINDFFAPIQENSYDLNVLKEFFAFMIERVCEETKQTEDFLPLMREYPDILEVVEGLNDKMKQHQIVKTKTIQGVLCCSEEDAAIFVDYFIRFELIERLDAEDSYFVIKSAFDGLRMMTFVMMETCELIEKSKSTAPD